MTYVPSQDTRKIKPFEIEDGKVKMETTTQELTEDRGKVYGPPQFHFTCTQNMYSNWMARRNLAAGWEVNGLYHAVYMILDKLSRLAETIDHKDSWDDIQGYAECAKKIISGEKE